MPSWGWKRARINRARNITNRNYKIKKNSRVKFFESEKTLQMTSESENMYVCV